MTSVADDPTILPPRHRHLVVPIPPVDNARLEAAAIAEAMSRMAGTARCTLSAFSPIHDRELARFQALERRLAKLATRMRGSEGAPRG